jgi:hypothetical protein
LNNGAAPQGNGNYQNNLSNTVNYSGFQDVDQYENKGSNTNNGFPQIFGFGAAQF